MTVEEILAGNLYEDRRGIGWMSHPISGWFTPEIEMPSGGYRHLTRDQMRLLIERDMHRDECAGLEWCTDHPVPFVALTGDEAPWVVISARSEQYTEHDAHAEAMNAAYRLAVGE